jgi:hypothetical protein
LRHQIGAAQQFNGIIQALSTITQISDSVASIALSEGIFAISNNAQSRLALMGE